MTKLFQRLTTFMRTKKTYFNLVLFEQTYNTTEAITNIRLDLIIRNENDNVNTVVEKTIIAMMMPIDEVTARMLLVGVNYHKSS